jgi:hypothetical protein
MHSLPMERSMPQSLRTVAVTRYITPLREGGSLPAVVEADDGAMYVVKFRGAGQGVKALIAELVTGEIARAIGLPVPEIVFVDLHESIGRSEPDPEIQALLLASEGLNLALTYLPGALAFDPLVDPPPSDLASSVVWLDAYTTNVDRTPRNTNIMVWHKRLWLIDHGASLFFHHTWSDWLARSRRPMPQIKDHVLLPFAHTIADVDRVLTERLTTDVISGIVDLIPDGWLGDETQFGTIDEHRAAYVTYLIERLQEPRAFAEEAIHARDHRV